MDMPFIRKLILYITLNMQIFARFGSWSFLIGTTAAPQLRNRTFLLPRDGPAPKIVSMGKVTLPGSPLRAGCPGMGSAPRRWFAQSRTAKTRCALSRRHRRHQIFGFRRPTRTVGSLAPAVLIRIDKPVRPYQKILKTFV